MELDLRKLREMHPRLSTALAAGYGHQAAVGLEQRGHEPGVTLEARLDQETDQATVQWERPDPEDDAQLDNIRIIEQAAEAVALALVHQTRGWVIHRRLQRGEFADWLLEDRDTELIALEVSGVGEGSDPGRLGAKLQQVQQAETPTKAACVVELEQPRALLETIQSKP